MMREFAHRLGHNQAGATASEYGLIGALMAVVVIAVLGAFGPQLKQALEHIGSNMAEPPDVTSGG